MNDGPRILFVCTGNAGRSQMAEALFRVRGGGVTVYSAGVEPWSDLHPMARKLMAEQGIDLAGHYPKSVRAFAEQELELVVTIGDRAGAETPEFRTGVRRIHWDIRDPADADGTPDRRAAGRPGGAYEAASLAPGGRATTGGRHDLDPAGAVRSGASSSAIRRGRTDGD